MAIGKDKSRAFRSSLVTEVSKERQACAKNSKAAWALGGVTNVHSYIALVAVLGSAMVVKKMFFATTGFQGSDAGAEGFATWPIPIG